MKENEMIFGIRAIIEAIKSDKQIDKIILKNDMQSELAKELFNAIKGFSHIQVQRVPIERLNRYTHKNHQGAIAFVSQTTYQLVSDIVPTLYEEGKTPFTKESLSEYLSGYNGEMVSHSEEYRKAYSPAYRVVLEKLAENLQ